MTWLQKSESLWARSDGILVKRLSPPITGWIPCSPILALGIKHSARAAMLAADEKWPLPDPLPAAVDSGENVIGKWRDDPEFVEWLLKMGWVWTDRYDLDLRHSFESAGRYLRLMHMAWRAGRH